MKLNCNSEEIHKIQVYRIAALYKRSDVVDVQGRSHKRCTWFGSIAAITATIGTVLALISFILETLKHLLNAQIQHDKKNFCNSQKANRLLFACTTYHLHC